MFSTVCKYNVRAWSNVQRFWDFAFIYTVVVKVFSPYYSVYECKISETAHIWSNIILDQKHTFYGPTELKKSKLKIAGTES